MRPCVGLAIAAGVMAGTVLTLLTCGAPIGRGIMHVGARIAAAGGASPFVDAAHADAIVRVFAAEAVTAEVTKQRPTLAWSTATPVKAVRR